MQYFIINIDTLRIEKTYELAEGDTREWIPRLSAPNCVHLSLTENLDPACIKAVLIDDVITLVEDTDKVAAKVQAAKDVLVAAARASMDADVAASQLALLETAKETSAIRLAVTALDMSLNPSLYICSLFPTAEAVTAFANAKLAPSRQCAIYCLERIYQYEQEKAAILA